MLRKNTYTWGSLRPNPARIRLSVHSSSSSNLWGKCKPELPPVCWTSYIESHGSTTAEVHKELWLNLPSRSVHNFTPSLFSLAFWPLDQKTIERYANNVSHPHLDHKWPEGICEKWRFEVHKREQTYFLELQKLREASPKDYWKSRTDLSKKE